MSENDERIERLAAEVSDLAARVARLEGSGPGERTTPERVPAVKPGELDVDLLERLRGRAGPPYEEGGERGAVLYAGAARFGDRSYVWQVERPAPGLLEVEEDLLAGVLSALASPPRLRLLKALLRGSSGGQQLQKALGDASVGQLYHHMKELQAAGLVIQKGRGAYEVGAQAVVPLLAVLAAAYDLAERRDEAPPGESGKKPAPER